MSFAARATRAPALAVVWALLLCFLTVLPSRA
ncbi:MAG: hypothetical protein JWO72_2898, partial [Caulobacteraceae bacterium]|nr:hypothetical protein [Caulobacteraceae bacterium]